MINFIKNLKTITYNLFKIELINIKYQIMMIKNIIVLNIYNLMKTLNL